MANVDAAFGMKPVRYLSGKAYTGASIPCYLPGTASIYAYVGDPVKKVNTGTNAAEASAPGVGTIQAGVMPIVAPIAATDPIFGVVVGVAANPDALGTRHIAAAGSGIVFVATEPDLVYEIQESGASTLAATSAGLNASVTVAAGSSATGQSAVELDNTSAAASASLELMIIGLSNKADNALGANAVWEVTINNSQLGNKALGI